MKTKRVGWLLIFLSYVGVVLAQNLDDQERRWAISGSVCRESGVLSAVYAGENRALGKRRKEVGNTEVF